MMNSKYYFLTIIVLGLFLSSTFRKKLASLESSPASLKENYMQAFQSEEKTEGKKNKTPLPKNPDKKSSKLAKQKMIKNIIQKVSKETNTPADLIEAICRVESNLDSTAFRMNDGGRTNHAVGLCQVLRKTGEMVLSMRDEGCKKDYREVSRLERNKKACILFDTYTNVKAAALYLQIKMKRYKTLDEVIAAYNAGSNTRRKKSGELKNKGYVKKVQKELKDLKRQEDGLTRNS